MFFFEVANDVRALPVEWQMNLLRGRFERQTIGK